MIALLTLPALSYSQSKNDKYPKQTVLGRDTVVILSLTQAVEMNESFLEMQSKIDSVNSVVDTLKSVVIVKQSKTEQLQHQFNVATSQLDRKYKREHRINVSRDIFVTISVVTGFVMIVNVLN